MATHFSKVFFWICLALTGLAGVTTSGPYLQGAEPDEAVEARADALSAIRAACASRNDAQTDAALQAAGKLKGTDAKFDTELARLEELAEHLNQFWKAVDRAAQALEGTDELTIGEEVMSVVEYVGGKLVIRAAGTNREYTRANMPAGLALALAKRAFKVDVAQNKVFLGSFLAMDPKGDRRLAKKYWDEAAAGGVDVSRWLPELQAKRPAASVEIPTLTPPLKAILSPKNWSLRQPSDKEKNAEKPLFLRLAADKIAKQNSAGRLEVKIPDDAPAGTHLAMKRVFAGDFTCRLIVQAPQAGVELGLWPSEVSERGETWSLPKGDSLIEVRRQGGKLTVVIAETEQESVAGTGDGSKAEGKAAPKKSSILVILAPAGSELTIAALEAMGR